MQMGCTIWSLTQEDRIASGTGKHRGNENPLGGNGFFNSISIQVC